MAGSTSKAAEQAAERAEARASLRGDDPDYPGYMRPGDTVWTVVRYASRSGMMRCISPIVVGTMSNRHGTRPAPVDVSWLAARALGDRVHRDHGGVIVSGCGMDMGFHLVYSLSRVLYPDGFDCIGDGCPSNDHTNREDNAHHSDGGYALRHSRL
jgi:hypothetical protein